MNDHDELVAKAGDLWGTPHLIGVHCLVVPGSKSGIVLSVLGGKGTPVWSILQSNA